METERLILRKFNEDDIEAIYAIFSDIEVNTFLPWFPVASLEEAKQFFEREYADAWKYAICLKSDNLPIGYVNVKAEAPYDFGYGLRKEFWHKGIAAEAGKAVIRQLKKDGLTYITATHDVRNPRSGGVMKRLGMSYRYSYEELWKPKNELVTFRMYQLNLDGQDERVYEEYWNTSSVHFIESDV